MICAISGEAPEEPVVSKKSGLLFERRLIERHIADYGKCPVTGEQHTMDDIVAVKTNKAVKPRPLQAASIPGLLGMFQNEWDALMLSNFALEQQLHTARQELSHALYQHDAACRVIARLKKERDEARGLLAQAERQIPISSSVAAVTNASVVSNGKRGAEDEDLGPGGKRIRPGISADIIAELTDCNAMLSGQRKKRQIPPTLAPVDALERYTQLSSHPLHKTSKPGILSTDIHPSKDVIATGGVDTNAVLFDRLSGQILSTLMGHTKKVTSVKFVPRDELFVTGSGDKTVRLWQGSENGNYTCRHVLKDHTAEVGDRPAQMDTEASTSGTQARRTRGPNRCIALTNRRERIVVECNEYGQPIGMNERLLSSYIGVIARDGQKAPLTYSDWRRMPVERTTDMWEAIQAKFDLGNNEKTKRWVHIALSRSWRNWKATLKKKYYSPYHTIRDQLRHCPPRVNPDQWSSLATFWGSQEGVARSRRNSRNREAQTMSHTAGTKSFARIREEARARNPDGQVPDRMEVFRMTHTRRDGQLVDQASQDVMRQLNDRLSQHPESSQSSTTRDDIFTQVMGEDRRGRVRTFGLGVTPSDIFGPRASIAEARAAAAEARAAALESARIAEMERAQRIALQEEVVQMRTQLNQLMTWMQSFNGNGPSSSSSVPVFGATPNDTQHDD